LGSVEVVHVLEPGPERLQGEPAAVLARFVVLDEALDGTEERVDVAAAVEEDGSTVFTKAFDQLSPRLSPDVALSSTK